MESAISGTTVFTLSKTLISSSKLTKSRLHCHLSKPQLNQILQERFAFDTSRFRCICNGEFQRSNEFVSIFSSSSTSLWRATAPISSRLACISSSAAPFASIGGGDGVSGGGGGGGDGDGGSDGGETKSKSIGAESEEVLALSADVILLHVGGMTCGGCAASVKRILESQPQVSSATVNLETETAIVWPVAEIKDTQNWQQQFGEALAVHLTNCGFKSNFRGQGAIEGDIPS